MIVKRLCEHAWRVANSLTSKISSAPNSTITPRPLPSDWLGAALAIMFTLTLALLAGCTGVVSGKSTAPASVTAPAALQVATAILPVGTMGSGYAAPLQATGGTSPYTWSLATGSLPAGLTLSPGGVISGTPTAAGSSNFTINVTDSTAPHAQMAVSLALTVNAPGPLTLSVPGNMPPATQGQAYSSGSGTGPGGAVLNILGGMPPFTCWVSAGSLPPGMSVSQVTPVYPTALCILTGTPSAAGTFAFTVQVTDSASHTASQNVAFVVKSSARPVISGVTATSASPTSETITWTTSSPASSKVCYSIGYAVNTCTAEQDAGGVTSHSVTLTTLWPSTIYQYFVNSRGVSGGSPQDYLTVTDGDVSGCCSDGFTTAGPGAGLLDFYVTPAGPQNVIQGYPMLVGIHYGPITGASGTQNLKFVVTGLPPNSQVHWPDQQDNALGQGTVGTATTTNDSLTLFGLAAAGSTQFEILTNVGGTTPAGNYMLTVTAAATTGVTHTFTWPIGVGTASFPSGSPQGYPLIPSLSLWQSNMIAPWPSGSTGQGNWYNGKNRVGQCEYATDDQGIQYYDGAWVYDQIGMYTGNLSFWTVGSHASSCPSAGGPQGAAAALALYHQYVSAQSGNVHGYWVFPHGFYYDCVSNHNATSCSDLHSLANGSNGSLIANNGGYFDATNIRESCYALGARRLDYDAGGGSSTLAQIKQLVAYCVGHVDNLVNGTAGFEQPFMDGLAAQALIEYYMDPKTGNQTDVRIPPAIKALADHLWNVAWISWAGNNGYFPYNLIQYNNGIPVVTGGSDLQNLNLLIAPMYAWVYKFTGLPQYQLEGDAIWASGVNDPPSQGLGWSGKNFSQQYRWSFDYVAWRSGQ